MVLNFALNYGSRAEIITGVKKIATEVQNGNLAVDEINENMISKSLMTEEVAPYNDPDLLIRTSGEERISNFLLWQIAYSELVFTDKLWPEYQPDDLVHDIYEFQQRDRRFGGVKDTKGGKSK